MAIVHAISRRGERGVIQRKWPKKGSVPIRIGIAGNVMNIMNIITPGNDVYTRRVRTQISQGSAGADEPITKGTGVDRPPSHDRHPITFDWPSLLDV